MAERRLDAVLPLRVRDYDRFRLLDRSMRRNFRDLNICWVVTTDREYPVLRDRVQGEAYEVVPESHIIPEIGVYRSLHRLISTSRLFTRLARGKLDVTGWYVQQLVKLAIAERVQTEFYLTLDADVVCLKPVTFDDLVPGGRAITNTREEDVHPDWYRQAERILGVARPGLTHGVTPALFSRSAMIELHRFLATKVGRVARGLAACLPRRSALHCALRSWRGFLLRNTPWTEYTLYHTFLENAGKFDRYHVGRGPDAIYDNRSAVWNREEFHTLDLANLLNSAAFFLVIQSNTDIPPDEVWDKIRAHLPGA